MSIFKAEVIKIQLSKHENADSLSVVKVRGWEVVVKTLDFQSERFGIYIPLDAVAKPDHPLLAFLEGKKVRARKLRGVFSQGVLIPLTSAKNYYDNLHRKNYGVPHPEFVWHEGSDVTNILEIKKWEPEILPSSLKGGKDKKGNPTSHEEISAPEWFSKYTDIENINNYPDLIEEKECVDASLKLHGTSFRAGLIDGKVYLGSRNRTLRLEPITIKIPKYNRFIVSILTKVGLKNYTTKNKIIEPAYTVWHQVFEQFNIKEKLQQLAEYYGASKVAIYGEIVNVQKGFNYGCKQAELDFYVYDIRLDKKISLSHDSEYLSPSALEAAVRTVGLKKAPTLYFGPFNSSVLQLANGVDPIGKAHVREGIIIKPSIPRQDFKIGRVILKLKGEDYLLKEHVTTDY